MPFDFDKIIDRRQTNSFKWTSYPEDVLPMWVADMDFAAPEPVLDALRRAVNHGVLGYEFPRRRLKESVAALMERLYNWRVDPDAVLPVPGLVTGFNIAAAIVSSAGDGILVQPPVYFPFLKVHENLTLVRQDAPLVAVREEHTLHYEVDFDIFDHAIHSNNARTKTFLLCNPHNPTGVAYDRETLERMAERCLREDILLCSDEIHSELLLGETKHIPIATLSPEVEAKSVTLVAASKTFNVAGLFTGFAIVPEKTLRARYQHEIERMTLHVNSLGQIAAEVAFSGVCDDWLAEVNAYLTANRDYVVDFVRSELPGIRVTVPQATYLAWLDFGDWMRERGISESPHEFLLKNGKIALNDGATFGTGGEGFVRLNFGCPRALLEEGLSRIKRAVSTR
jgi:cystathionine beta-lyase